jgi:putative ABC transport system substrate-binding protein
VEAAENMNRKVAVLVLILGVMHLALGVAVHAQQQAKVAKIGWFRARPASSSPASAHDVIRRVLSNLGYVEGKNIAFEYRYTEGKLDRLPAFADELLRLKVDVFLTSSTAETLAVKNATSTIPIVFYSGGDPVAGWAGG